MRRRRQLVRIEFRVGQHVLVREGAGDSEWDSEYVVSEVSSYQGIRTVRFVPEHAWRKAHGQAAEIIAAQLPQPPEAQ